MRIAVIGLGHIGTRRLRLLRGALGQDDVVAYDADPRRCERVAADCECVACADEGEVWEHRPDAVLVCTPPESHWHWGSEAASRRLTALFIEKPLDDRVNDPRLYADWDYIDRSIPTTMVACNMRFHPGPAQVKAWLAEGRIGEPLWARFETASWLPDWHPSEDWRASYSASVGATLDCGSHELDVALWMLGEATLAGAVLRKAERLDLDCDGMVEMLLDHDLGAVSTVRASFMERNHQRTITLAGTAGDMLWDWDAEVAALNTFDGSGKQVFVPNDVDAMYAAEMRHFIDCAERGAPTCNPIGQASETLRILLEARGG